MNQNLFRVDIRETDNFYLVEAELRDIKNGDVSVEYSNNYMTISAEREYRKEDTTDYIRQERYFGELRRSFYVDDIDESKVQASYHEGMLRVVLPKQF